MKIRSNYVSNSSSSSFILAYDPLFFGNIEAFFREECVGEETRFDNLNEFLKENSEYTDKIKQLKKEGKNIIYIRLDQEFFSIITLMKMIN